MLNSGLSFFVWGRHVLLKVVIANMRFLSQDALYIANMVIHHFDWLNMTEAQ